MPRIFVDTMMNAQGTHYIHTYVYIVTEYCGLLCIADHDSYMWKDQPFYCFEKHQFEIPYSAIIGRGKILANSLSQRIGGEIFGES